MSKELEQLIASLEKNHETVKANAAGGFRDDRILSVPLGKTVVRILPPVPGSGLADPWVKKFHHTFHSAVNGQLVTLDCPTSVGMPCRICENNMKLYADKTEASKRIASKYKRKQGFACNVFVKESKETSEVGYVKVYRYGIKVQEKMKKGLEIHGIVYLPNEDGSDFVIYKEIKKTPEGDFPDYDSSSWYPKTSLAKDDKKTMEIIKQGYDLKEFQAQIDEKDPDLSDAFHRHVLGETSGPAEVEAPVKARKDLTEGPTPAPSFEEDLPEDKPEIINMREEIEGKEEVPSVDEGPDLSDDDEIDEEALLAELEASMKDE